MGTSGGRRRSRARREIGTDDYRQSRVLHLHPPRAPSGPGSGSSTHPSGVIFLTASGVAVYSLDLLGGQPRDVIGEGASHDLGIEPLKQRNGSEPLPLRGSLATSRLSL